MTITLYSKPDCSACRIAKKDMRARGIEFAEIDASKDLDAQKFLASLGYRSVPVTHTSDGQHWFGFRPDIIKCLV